MTEQHFQLQTVRRISLSHVSLRVFYKHWNYLVLGCKLNKKIFNSGGKKSLNTSVDIQMLSEITCFPLAYKVFASEWRAIYCETALSDEKLKKKTFRCIWGVWKLSLDGTVLDACLLFFIFVLVLFRNLSACWLMFQQSGVDFTLSCQCFSSSVSSSKSRTVGNMKMQRKALLLFL